MMSFTKLYQASFFGDFADIKPDVELIVKLIDKLKKFELIPNTASEYEFTNTGINTTQRLELCSQDKKFSIRFERERILFEEKRIKEEMITVDEFIVKVIDISRIFYDFFDRKGKRLSLVVDSFKESSIEDLNAKYNDFIVSKSLYNQIIPDEWNLRQVSIKKYSEINDQNVNIISEFSRVKVSKDQKGIMKLMNGVRLLLDINTYQEDISPRFNVDDFENFLNVAKVDWETISKDFVGE